MFCLFVCLFFYRYGKGMKRKSAVVDYDSFTLISVAVVHYNCVPSSSAPSLWKQILLFWEDTSLNFNIDIGHLFNIELLQQGEAGKHYLIILRTSERLLFPRHKRYSNEAKTNYGELGSCFAKCFFFFFFFKEKKRQSNAGIISVRHALSSLSGRERSPVVSRGQRASGVSFRCELGKNVTYNYKGKASKNKPTSTLPHPRPHLTRLLPLGIVDILFIV